MVYSLPAVAMAAGSLGDNSRGLLTRLPPAWACESRPNWYAMFLPSQGLLGFFS